MGDWLEEFYDNFVLGLPLKLQLFYWKRKYKKLDERDPRRLTAAYQIGWLIFRNLNNTSLKNEILDLDKNSKNISDKKILKNLAERIEVLIPLRLKEIPKYLDEMQIYIDILVKYKSNRLAKELIDIKNNYIKMEKSYCGEILKRINTKIN